MGSLKENVIGLQNWIAFKYVTHAKTEMLMQQRFQAHSGLGVVGLTNVFYHFLELKHKQMRRSVHISYEPHL